MYKNHFGLEGRLFHGNAAGDDVFVGPGTAALLTDINKALAAPDAVVTVTGPVGCGKSTAAAHSLRAISGKNAIVRVGRLPLQRGELLDLLFDHMRIRRRPQRGNQKLALFRQLLLNLAENDSRMFILVEDALFLGPDMLAELEAITAADSGPSDGAAVVVMGDDYLEDLLASKSLARLRQRVRLRRNLEPCGVEELRDYLCHCFRQAGGDFDRVFADGAAEHLHVLSGGILRVINNLVESSLEAAAGDKADVVSLEVISRTADEEFGLAGAFTRLPEISREQPEPRHSDDSTADPGASSMPGPKPAIGPAAQGPAEQDDTLPDLTQDAQPALEILDDAPPPPEQDTLPDIEQLAAELSARPDMDDESPAEATQPPMSRARTKTAPSPVQAPESVEQPHPEAELEPDVQPQPRQRSGAGEAMPALADAAATIAETSSRQTTRDDVPDWERDPTFAELRPDLDALERAMAVAHGRDPDAPEDSAPAPKPVTQDLPQDETEDIPEITLDDSINRKVDRAALESKQPADTEGHREEEHESEEESGKDEGTAGDRAPDGKPTAELEQIAFGLSKAKTIEDVDDKMAETLFGEELNAAAAAVAARVAEEAAAAAALPDTPDSNGQPVATATEQEFENVWGERPGSEISIECQIEDQKAGLDVSASQRLATVRALNASQPDASLQQAVAVAAPAANPCPIEEQITTSLTQTMKALKVSPEPRAVNDDEDDDEDEPKGGFFSRFRRS
jgi:type II secretory pathway predicted ATPase ExeA